MVTLTLRMRRIMMVVMVMKEVVKKEEEEENEKEKNKIFLGQPGNQGGHHLFPPSDYTTSYPLVES